MAIDRTFLNAWIDDSGSGVDGTVWNKARINEMLNAIDAADAALVAGNGTIQPPFKLPSYLQFAMASPTYNDFAPPSGTSKIVWLLQPSLATILTGIGSEGFGTQHLIVNGGQYAITLKNQHSGSAAPNRIVTPGFADYVIPANYASAWIYYMQALNAWVVTAAAP